MENKQILILDHDVDIHILLSLQVESQGMLPFNAFNISEAINLVDLVDFDAIVVTCAFYKKYQKEISKLIHQSQCRYDSTLSILVMGGFSSKVFVQDLKDTLDIQTKVQSFESFQNNDQNLEHPLQSCA